MIGAHIAPEQPRTRVLSLAELATTSERKRRLNRTMIVKYKAQGGAQAQAPLGSRLSPLP
jgi:hypothetical protein